MTNAIYGSIRVLEDSVFIIGWNTKGTENRFMIVQDFIFVGVGYMYGCQGNWQYLIPLSRSL
jgi:hypothetical protein